MQSLWEDSDFPNQSVESAKHYSIGHPFNIIEAFLFIIYSNSLTREGNHGINYRNVDNNIDRNI